MPTAQDLRRLPICNDDDIPCNDSCSPRGTRQAVPARVQWSTMSRILVVDDNADLCLAMTRLLRRFGHEVDAAYDGEEALEAVRTRRPDLIILDVMMPK